jgi:hypothetical protein
VKLRLTRLAVIGLGLAGLSFGSTIVSTLGLPVQATGFEPLNNPLAGINAYAVEWSQADTWNNVSVAAALNSPGQSTSIDAWITDGAGDVLFSDLNDTVPISTGAHLQNLFTGIDLGPGTYYLLIAPPTTTTNANWVQESGDAASTSADAAFLGSFTSFGGSVADPLVAHPNNFPGGTSNALAFSISSATAPEPATAALFLGALAGMFLTSRAKRHR